MSDESWPLVASLVHFDGADGGSEITDETGRVWTRSGTARISTAQSRFGGSSGLFDSSTSRVSSGPSRDFTFGLGASTVEMWVRPASVTAGYRVLVSDDRYPSGGGWRLYQSGADLELWYQDIIMLHRASGALAAGVWAHVAWVRTTSSSLIFVNGVLSASSTASFLDLIGTGVHVGMASGYAFVGHIDELRITKGQARYTGAFTPAIEAFPRGQVGVTPAAVGRTLRRAAPPAGGVRAVIPMRSRSVEHGGRGRIRGRTLEYINPATNAPYPCRTRLVREVDGLQVSEQWSRADGSYDFQWVDERWSYAVWAQYAGHAKRAVIADGISRDSGLMERMA